MRSVTRPGVPVSKIYPGLQSGYWICAPAQYDPDRPAALMVWQDGQGHVARNSRRSQNVIDSLIAQKNPSHGNAELPGSLA